MRVAIWAGGLASLGGMVAFSLATTTPYATSWPWISFMAMAILEEVLIGSRRGGPSRGVRIVLVAAIIMFRKHPDVTAVVTVAAGVAGQVLTRQPWVAVLTRTASLLILAATGTAALRVVGYADTPHFVSATVALILLYAAGIAIIDRKRSPLLASLGAGMLGALFALAWRTPASGPFMLRLGELAILAVVGIAIGSALGGNPRGILARKLSLRTVPIPAILGGAVLLLSTRIPGQPGALLAAIGLATIGVWAVRRGWFPVACVLLGGLCNEIARLANGGRMPVAIADLPPGLEGDFANLTQTSPLYQAVDAHTRLGWLADRFPLTPFPGIASPGDIVLALGIVWIFAALTNQTPVKVSALRRSTSSQTGPWRAAAGDP